LVTQESDEFNSVIDCFVFTVGGDMHDTTSTAMRLWSTEAVHVNVFTGNRSNYFGSGHKDSTGRAKDHNVGQRRTVGRTTSRWAKDNGDLGDFATCPGHRKKNATYTVKTCDAFAQARPTGVPNANDRGRVSQRAVISGDDRSATHGTHCSTLHGWVGAESDAMNAAGGTNRGEDSAVVYWSDCGELTVVKEFG
jgi:hypothetical protein